MQVCCRYDNGQELKQTALLELTERCEMAEQTKHELETELVYEGIAK